MRAITTAVFSLLVITFFALPAWADVFSISADIPVNYSFDNSQLTDTDASGFKAMAILPFHLGFGFEQYEVTGKIGGSTGPDFQYDVSFVDIFYEFPFPVLNLAVGIGVGKGEFDEVPETGTFSDANLTQWFVSLGYPFALVFDIHIGYHAISGESDITGSTTPLDLNANMTTIGFKFGF